MLIEHCGMVLQMCEKEPRAIDAKEQEMIVMYYWSSLMKHAEALNNGELLAKAREFNLVHLCTNHVLTHGKEYPLDLVHSVAEGFAALADNEDFRTNWPDFFTIDGQPDVSLKQTFLKLEGELSNRVIQENPDMKREIRPLLDFFNTIKRSMR